MTDVEQRLRDAFAYRGDRITHETLQQPALRPQRRRVPRVTAALAAAACVLTIAAAGLLTHAFTRTRTGGAANPTLPVTGSLLLTEAVSGHLYAIAGKVILHGPRTYTIDVPATGRFAHNLSPGTYTVTVQTPGRTPPVIAWQPTRITIATTRVTKIRITTQDGTG